MGAIRDQFAAMAAKCRDQVRLALDAFWTGSKERLAEVQLSDVAVNEAEKSIDALLLRMLALRQPVAADLRALTASFKLVTDLERIGDEAVNIARGSASTSPDAEPILARLHRMADASTQLLSSAVASFLQANAPLADSVRGTNGPIDALYEQVLCDSIAFISQHPTEVAPAMASMEVAKCLRRIADHARNIAEGTIFVVRGDEQMPR